MNGRDYPEQYDEPEPDLRNDPDYERFDEAYTADYIELMDGYADEVTL